MVILAENRKAGVTLVRLFVICSLLTVGLARSAVADTYTYSYTGLPFGVWFDSGCPPECSVTGSIPFASPLPANLPWATPLLTVDPPISYSFTDGLNTFTQGNSSFNDQFGSAFDGSTPYIATGNSGSITSWSLVFSSGNLELILATNPGSDRILISCCSAGVNIQAGSDGPGSWSGPTVNPSPVPEPSSFGMLTTLLACAIGITSRRRTAP